MDISSGTAPPTAAAAASASSLTPEGFRSCMEQHFVSLQKREAEFAELQRDKAELGVKIAGLTNENATLMRKNIELTAVAAVDAEKIRDLECRLRESEGLQDRLIRVKDEKMDITQDLFAAADHVNRVQGEKRRAESELEEEKQHHQQRVAQHQAERKQLEQKVEELTKTCVICLDAPPTLRFDPCGHVAVCAGCDSDQTAACPICRAKITTRQKAFI
jgi:chromosome segregation ATPase